jgi:cell fate regulator YaaT (PSP1 superfamily)
MDKETIICTRGVKIKTAEGSDPNVCLSNGCSKHSIYNWVDDLPEIPQNYDVIEVQFKNTRKGFYRNVNNISLKRGDVVAVESSPGHDIGVITLTGWLVSRQVKRVGTPSDGTEMKKVYRKAKPADIEKWLEAIDQENKTMIRSRQIASEMNLNMKIGDVEYQGDRTKAIFYYIADERVDFRELIKILADEFKVRIEMRQIGARQEAGRIGGIGSCGRELCCSSWITNFVSVSTNSARIQEISLNPQKLAGQCGKLKCCLNYEVDCYVDAKKDFPRSNIPLETKEATYFYLKTDIFKRIMWYSSDPNAAVNLAAISVDRVKEIIELNKKGEKPLKLDDSKSTQPLKPEGGYSNVDVEDSLTRFDEKKSKPQRKKRNKRRKGNA